MVCKGSAVPSVLQATKERVEFSLQVLLGAMRQALQAGAAPRGAGQGTTPEATGFWPGAAARASAEALLLQLQSGDAEAEDTFAALLDACAGSAAVAGLVPVHRAVESYDFEAAARQLQVLLTQHPA